MRMSIRKLALLVLLALPLAAADRVRYVDTGSSGGDGTTAATSGANAAYVSLSACLTAEHTADSDLTDEGYLLIHCNRTNGGAMDTTVAVVLDTWASDATHCVKIVQDDFPATGVFDNTKYVLHNNDTDTYTLSLFDDFTIVSPLQVQLTTTVSSKYGVYIDNQTVAGGVILNRCFINGVCSGTGAAEGMRIDDASVDAEVWNTVVTGFVSGADTGFRGLFISTGEVNIYNCTFYNNYYGVYHSTAGTTDAINCAVFSNADDFFTDEGTLTIDCCASDDADGTNAVDLNENASGEWTAAFSNYAGLDFRVKDASSLLYNAGNGATPKALFTVDMINTSRPQGGVADGDWDIGAFELVPTTSSGQAVVIVED